MFEIIEDNKHLILLIFVAILFFSSIFANKYSTKFNKKKLIKDSLNLLRKEAPNMNRRKKVFSNIPFYPNYNCPLPQMPPSQIQPKQQSFSPPQENTYKNEISKESIEDTIKDIKKKKEAKITNNIISKALSSTQNLPATLVESTVTQGVRLPRVRRGHASHRVGFFNNVKPHKIITIKDLTFDRGGSRQDPPSPFRMKTSFDQL